MEKILENFHRIVVSTDEENDCLKFFGESSVCDISFTVHNGDEFGELLFELKETYPSYASIVYGLVSIIFKVCSDNGRIFKFLGQESLNSFYKEWVYYKLCKFMKKVNIEQVKFDDMKALLEKYYFIDLVMKE